MLSIRWGKTIETVIYVDVVFDEIYEDEWFNDLLVREMILDVDKSEVISPYCIQSPVLGQIAPEKLSSGVKALILALKTDFEVWATVCGDNCAKWFLRIAQQKDITISINHFFRFPDNHFEFIDADTHEHYFDYLEWTFHYYGTKEFN